MSDEQNDGLADTQNDGLAEQDALLHQENPGIYPAPPGSSQPPDAYTLQQQRDAAEAAAQQQVAYAAQQQEAAAEMAAMQKESADALASWQSKPVAGGDSSAATDSDPAPEEHKGGVHSHAQSRSPAADNSQSSQPPPSPLEQAQGKVAGAQQDLTDALNNSAPGVITISGGVEVPDIKSMTPDDFRDHLEHEVGGMVSAATSIAEYGQPADRVSSAKSVVQQGNVFLEQIQKPGLTNADLAKSLQEFQDGLKTKVGDDARIEDASVDYGGSNYQHVNAWHEALDARINLDQQTAGTTPQTPAPPPQTPKITAPRAPSL